MVKKIISFSIFTIAALALFYAPRDSYAAAPDAGYFLYEGTDLAIYSLIAPGSSLDTGDIDGDGAEEIIVGSPPGIPPKVTIFELDGSIVRSFQPFGSGMAAGLNVAVGNLTGSGMEIIVVPRRGAGPHILRFNSQGRLLSPGFFAYSERFHGGVNLAAGDVNGDGKDEIITGAGPGGGPHVKALSKDGLLVAQILPEQAFPGEQFFGGVVVGAIDYDNDGRDEFVIAPQSQRVADVKVYEPFSRTQIKTFRAYGNFSGGVSMDINTTGGGKRVLLGAGAGGGPHVLQYNLQTGAVDGVNIFPFDDTWRGGVEVSFVKYDGGVKFVASAGVVRLSVTDLQTYGANITSSETPTNTSNEIGGVNSLWKRETITTDVGQFSIQYVKAYLKNPKLRVRSITGSSKDCFGVPCVTRSLDSYVTQVNGFAGINGSYFCPADYASCANEPGSFYWLWYNTLTRIFSNSYQNQFNQGPVIAFDTNNTYYYYKVAKDWPGKEKFEADNKTVLRAAISNGPGLMFEGQLVVSTDQLDDKQRTVKSNRSGIGFKGDYVYMVVASGATVQDLGYIMKALGTEHAMNLDGGGSSALWYDGQYRVGPGRNIPNAFVLTEN